MINLRKTLMDAHQLLLKHQIDHALIGGFAMAVHGFHRATVDIDFLADGTKRDLISDLFTQNHYKLVHQSPEVLQFIGPGVIDILLANRPLSQAMLKRAMRDESLGVYVVHAEDIIGLKIQAYKNDPQREHQDKADIQKLLSLPQLDLPQVKIYADLFGEWDEILNLQKLVKK